MNKTLKTLLIFAACVIALVVLGGTAALVAVGRMANIDEYTIGNDTVQSVKSVVAERKVTSVSSKVSDGVTTKSMHYKSDSVQNDLNAYIPYLMDEAGFILTQDMDLSVIPATVQMAKASNDSGKILVLTIDYDAFGYTITLQKGEGQLTLYE